MSEREQDKQTRKAAMKALREERKAFIKTASGKSEAPEKSCPLHPGSTQGWAADGSRPCCGNRRFDRGNTLVCGCP
jgi:hypothetical protein